MKILLRDSMNSADKSTIHLAQVPRTGEEIHLWNGTILEVLKVVWFPIKGEEHVACLSVRELS